MGRRWRSDQHDVVSARRVFDGTAAAAAAVVEAPETLTSRHVGGGDFNGPASPRRPGHDVGRKRFCTRVETERRYGTVAAATAAACETADRSGA